MKTRRVGLIVAVFLAAAGLGGAASLAINLNTDRSTEAAQEADVAQQQAAIQAEHVRQSNLANCAASKRPGGVRFILAGIIRDDIKQSPAEKELIGQLGLDPAQLRALRQVQIAKAEEKIDSLLDVNCEELFPPPPVHQP